MSNEDLKFVIENLLSMWHNGADPDKILELIEKEIDRVRS